MSPALAGGFFTTSTPGKPIYIYIHMCVYIYIYIFPCFSLTVCNILLSACPINNVVLSVLSTKHLLNSSPPAIMSFLGDCTEPLNHFPACPVSPCEKPLLQAKGRVVLLGKNTAIVPWTENLWLPRGQVQPPFRPKARSSSQDHPNRSTSSFSLGTALCPLSCSPVSDPYWHTRWFCTCCDFCLSFPSSFPPHGEFLVTVQHPGKWCSPYKPSPAPSF